MDLLYLGVRRGIAALTWDYGAVASTPRNKWLGREL
jgi:hypothetical protein